MRVDFERVDLVRVDFVRVDFVRLNHDGDLLGGYSLG